MNTSSDLLSFSFDLAERASEEIIPRFRRCSVKYKSDGTEVTDADRAAERIMRRMIGERFPYDAVLGEELGHSQSKHSRRTWILDPIDGTAWFTLGVPMFGTLIAVCEDDEPIVGVMHFPMLRETVYAARGAGCWFKSDDGIQRVRVAEYQPLRSATVCASGAHASNIQPLPNAASYDLSSVLNEARKFKFGGDCLQHALVCRGRIHAAIDTVMKPWDIAAIVPCVEEAGGTVTNLAGDRVSILHGGTLLASCSAVLHNEILQKLNAFTSLEPLAFEHTLRVG